MALMHFGLTRRTALLFAAGLAVATALPAAAQETGGPMFPAFVARQAEVDSVTIEARRYTITLERRDGVWVAVDHGDYPVRQTVLAPLLAALAGMTAYDIRSEDPARYAIYDVLAPSPSAEDIHVRAAAGADVLVDALIGAPASVPGTPPRSGMYVRRADEAAVWLAVGGFTPPLRLPAWFDQLFQVPGRDVSEVTLQAGEKVLLDAVKVDFATGHYQLAAIDPALVGAAQPILDENAIRSLSSAIASGAFEDARLRSTVPVPDEPRILVFQTRTGLSLTITFVDVDGATWFTFDATAADGSEATALAAAIRTRTEAWAFRLAENITLQLSRDVSEMFSVNFDPGAPPL